MRDERTIMAAVIAGGICAHGNPGVTSKPAHVASEALKVADAIIAQVEAEEQATYNALVAQRAAERKAAETEPTTGDSDPASGGNSETNTEGEGA